MHIGLGNLVSFLEAKPRFADAHFATLMRVRVAKRFYSESKRKFSEPLTTPTGIKLE